MRENKEELANLTEENLKGVIDDDEIKELMEGKHQLAIESKQELQTNQKEGKLGKGDHVEPYYGEITFNQTNNNNNINARNYTSVNNQGKARASKAATKKASYFMFAVYLTDSKANTED
jgi:hypothetical protein